MGRPRKVGESMHTCDCGAVAVRTQGGKNWVCQRCFDIRPDEYHRHTSGSGSAMPVHALHLTL